MIRLLSWAVVFAGLAPAQQSGVISGVVRNAWSASPLRRAIVTLSTTGDQPMDAVTYSDGNGVFGFSGVPAGSYYLCARFQGYQRACFGANEPGQPGDELILRRGQTHGNVILAMLPEGSVSGTVTDSDGDPILNAQIQLLRPVYKRRTLHWLPGISATTNDRGEYRIPFVTPGEYRVVATHAFQIASRVQPEAVNGEKIPEELYASEFYPGADTVDGAASLTLNAGNDLKSIDFTLHSVPQVLVSGRVDIPRDMQDQQNVSVALVPLSSGLRSEPIMSNAGPPDYHFGLNVYPGRYQLVAAAHDEDHDYRTVQSLELSGNTDDIAVPLTAGSPLSGKLQFEGAGAKEHGPYTVELLAGDELPLFGQAPSAEVNEDGTFTFDSVVPGIWDIAVRPEPDGSFIKSMRLGTLDVLTADMELKNGERAPLNIVLSMNGAVVVGDVQDAPSTAGAAARRHEGRVMVLLAPDGKWENVLSFYQLRPSDGHGHFEFKSVTPGNYKLYAFDEMQGDEYWKPGFLPPFRDRGTPLVAAEGARVNTSGILIRRAPEGMATNAVQ